MVEEVRAWKASDGSLHQSVEGAEQTERVHETRARIHRETGEKLAAAGFRRLSKVTGPVKFSVNGWRGNDRGVYVRLYLGAAQSNDEDADPYFIDVPLSEFLAKWRLAE